MSFQDVCMLNWVAKGSTKVWSFWSLAKLHAEVVRAKFIRVISIIPVKICIFCVIVFKQRPNGICQRAFCDLRGRKYRVSNTLLATLTQRRPPNPK